MASFLYVPEPGVFVAPRPILLELVRQLEENNKKKRESDDLFFAKTQLLAEDQVRIENLEKFYIEQKLEEEQQLKAEEKEIQKHHKEEADALAEQHSAAPHATPDPFDIALQGNWFENLFAQVGDKAFNLYKADQWQAPLDSLARNVVNSLEDPLTVVANDKLKHVMEQNPELRDHMAKTWETIQQDMQAALATRAALEDVCKIVPRFQHMSKDQAAQAFAPTQTLNSMAIPAANYVQYFMAVDRELKKLNPKSSLQEIFGKSAVKLGVECAERGMGPNGKLKHYHEQLQQLGHDFSKCLENHIHKGHKLDQAATSPEAENEQAAEARHFHRR